VVDSTIAFLAIATASVLWRSAGPLDVGFRRSLTAVLVITTLFSVTNWITGVQRVHWRYASPGDAIGVIGSAFISTVLTVIINSLVPPPRFPVEMLIMVGVFALSGFLVTRYHRRLLLGLGSMLENLRKATIAGRERVLVVGAGAAGQLTIWLLRNNPAGRAFYVVGVVDDDLNLLGTLVHRVPVLGVCDHIPEIVREKDVGTIIFAMHNIEENRRQYLLRRCKETTVRTVIVPDLIASLRKGMESTNDTLIASRESGEDTMDATIFEGVSIDLQQQIHWLTELARVGDFDGVGQRLEKLDEALQATIPADTVLSSEKMTPITQVGDQYSQMS